MKIILQLLLFLLAGNLQGQSDTTYKELKFTGDFRFRIEHDWNSRNGLGVLRNNRDRLRYRFRFGLNYQLDQYSTFGGRVRTGNLNDQQGPHVTLGGNNGEFGLVQVGFEKLFYQYQIKGFKGWVGKNTILMKKENELFWNDNVFPEGVAASYRWNLEEKIINSFQINGGHYIIRSNNKTFSEDSYFQLVQLSTSHFKDKLSLYPGFYYFNNIGNFPDKQETYTLSYSILHLGTKVDILQRPKLSAGIDYYLNLQNYNRADSIRAELKDQKNGWVLSLKLGQLNKKGDWQAHLYYAHIEKYAIVDYFAQNDWARWDYSSVNASGARLSNFQGLEFRLGYAFKQKFNLILRAYKVEELIKLGNFKETGDRIRLDMNIGF